MDADELLGVLCTLNTEGDSNPDGDTTKDMVGVNFFKTDTNCWSHFEFVLLNVPNFTQPGFQVKEFRPKIA